MGEKVLKGHTSQELVDIYWRERQCDQSTQRPSCLTAGQKHQIAVESTFPPHVSPQMSRVNISEIRVDTQVDGDAEMC
eukprot:scaffold1171_cov212-Alexandrium_tamarense.AAC.9